MPVGWPDITGILKSTPNFPQPFFIEVKTASGKISIEQAAFLSKALKFGAIAFVARSLDDVNRHLKDRLIDY